MNPDPLTIWPDDEPRAQRRRSARIAVLCILAAAAIVALAYLGGPVR